jgi:hypothetical protein
MYCHMMREKTERRRRNLAKQLKRKPMALREIFAGGYELSRQTLIADLRAIGATRTGTFRDARWSV